MRKMKWRNLKQAWYTADLILNGFLRQEHVEVTWWDPQRHSNVVRKYSYEGELAKIGTEWPESEKECGLFWRKIVLEQELEEREEAKKERTRCLNG